MGQRRDYRHPPGCDRDEHSRGRTNHCAVAGADFTWKGVEITPPGGIPTTFSPIPGRIVFGGRTGGSWLVHHVDNITLVTIPADKIVISKVTGTPTGFALIIIDSGQSVLDPSKLQLKLNGSSVTASSVSKNTATGTSTIYYSGPVLTAGSTNTLDITAFDTL